MGEKDILLICETGRHAEQSNLPSARCKLATSYFEHTQSLRRSLDWKQISLGSTKQIMSLILNINLHFECKLATSYSEHTQSLRCSPTGNIIYQYTIHLNYLYTSINILQFECKLTTSYLEHTASLRRSLKSQPRNLFQDRYKLVVHVIPGS